jgi:hypothetical protein
MGTTWSTRHALLWAFLGVVALVTVAWVGQLEAAAKKRGDLVILEHDRWLDTLRGTVKNFSKQTAKDVTLVVKFLDKKRKPLGTQRVSVGDLKSGEQGSFDFSIEERNRAANSYEFTMHAIWQ